MAVVLQLRHPAPAIRRPAEPIPRMPAAVNPAEARPNVSEKEIDQQLVLRVQQGDKRAFDLLVGKYQHKIMSVISRYIRNPDEVQDVAQDTFVRAWRALPRFRGDSAFFTWLYRIAINTAKNQLVSKSRRPPDTDIDIDDAQFLDSADGLRDADTPLGHVLTDEIQATVKKALEDLPEDMRQAISLREFDGLSYEEIAEVMDCPVGTVRSRIFRARESINEALAPLLDNA
jgi:RNA polymerase sigma-70 factor (ECF subfamily)